jgi:glycosyltransferase involved in cell wall biosynthesis
MASLNLLTIITVVRNDSKSLLATLAGVSKYKGSRTEYIVIDGNSSDDTLSVIQSNLNVIDRYISEPDQGIYDAMNKGIALARGKYLLFLNAGDELLTDVEALIASVPDEPVLIYGKANMYAPDGRLLYVKGKPLKNVNQFLKGMPLCHQAILYRRDCMKNYDLRYKVYADRALTYQLVCTHGISSTRFVNSMMVNFYEDGFSSICAEESLREEQNQFYRNVGKQHYIYIKHAKALFKQHVKLPLQRLIGRQPKAKLTRLKP